MISRPAAAFFCVFLLVHAGAAAAANSNGREQILDAFRYGGAASAREAWKAAEGTPPVDLAVEHGDSTLLLAAPFATQPKLPRAVIDRRVRLDLRGAGGFALEIDVAPAEAVKYLTLYFHSRDGWYAAGSPLGKKGWQTAVFPKAEFRVEEKPGGWGEVDGIRIAAWRGDGARRRGPPPAARRRGTPDRPDHARRAARPQRRGRPALRHARRPRPRPGRGERRRLARRRIGPAADRRASDRGDLNEKAVAGLIRFVESGGKLFVCYAMPPRLGPVLGFKNPEYVRESRPGQFAEIRYVGSQPTEFPGSVRQHSWNIIAMQPTVRGFEYDGRNAWVAANWFDDAGRPTGRPALLLSDRGAFFSHIVLGDDRENMEQMLAAIIGSLDERPWKIVAEAAIDRAARVGHCRSVDDNVEFVMSARNSTDGANRLLLHVAHSRLSAAREHLSGGQFIAAYEDAGKAHQFFVAAYLRSQPSPSREGRAMWDHSGTGPYPGDWDRAAKILHENGFNMIVPNMLWAGQAHYASDILPRSATFRRWGDQIEQCVKAAKKYGLEVHVWKVNFNLGPSPKEFCDRMRREGRTQVTADGKPIDWLCPSNPENQRLERESMLEVARKYPIAGLHFDYIRYPDRNSCFCDGCRRRFEADSGRSVQNWPADCFHGPRQEEYNDWRCRQITTLVAAVHRDMKKIRPEAKLSAAVFGDYPECRREVAQDWPLWIRQGYLDFVCPMDYTKDDEQFTRLVRKQVKLVAGRVPIYAGIGIAGDYLPPDRVVGQIHIARSLGAGGFSIFALNASTAASLVPAIGQGVGRTPARPPHLP